MADYLNLLEKGAGAFGLEDDLALIESLVELAEKWSELAGKIEGAASAEDFIVTFAGDIDGATVREAFAAAGLSELHGKLAAPLSRLTARLGRVPEKYKMLLRPMSEFNAADAPANSGLVEWTILDAHREFEADEAFSFDLGATAALAFEAGDRPALAGAPAAGPLLRLSAEAGCRAKAGATIPIKFGSVSGGAEAKLETGLDYFFDTGAADALYGLAVATRLPSLPNPFSFDGLWEAFAASDLSAVMCRLTASTEAKIQIAVADSGSFGPDLLAELALTVGAAATSERHYVLIFQSVPAADGAAPNIRVTMTRDTESERKLNLGLKIGLDFSSLTGRVHELLKRAVEKSDRILAEITPYLRPGTFLQDQLGGLIDAQASQLIADDGLREALVRDLRGTIGVDVSDRSALEAWLAGRLAAAIDAAAAKITDQAGAVRDKALERLGDSRIAAFSEPAIHQAIAEQIDPLVAQVSERFRSKLLELIPNNLLGRALERAGVAVSGRIDSLDEALAPVRDFIGRYEDLLAKAVELADDESRARMMARLQIEEAWQFGTNDRIVGTFSARSDAARTVFEDITRGRLDALRSLVLGGSPTADFTLDPQSSIRRFAGRTTTVEHEIVLFGFGGSGRVKLDGSAALLIDADGRIQVDTRGALEAHYKGWSEKREVSLVNTFSLVRAKALSGSLQDSPSIEMGVSISHLDESLKLDEMQGFVRSLEEAGLVPAGTGTAATRQFAGWAGSVAPRAALAADLNARLWLTRTECERLMHLGDRGADGRLSDSVRQRLVRLAVDELDRAGARNRRALNVGKRKVEQEFGLPELGMPDFLLLLMRLEQARGDQKLVLSEAYRPRERNTDIQAVISEVARMKGLIGTVQTMGDIYLAQPRTGAQSPPGSWDETHYRDAQHALAGYGNRWVVAGGFLGTIMEDVPPVTVAFLSLVSKLAGIGSPADAVSLTLTRRKTEETVAETAVLA